MAYITGEPALLAQNMLAFGTTMPVRIKHAGEFGITVLQSITRWKSSRKVIIALQMSPGGITGQPPLDYSALAATTNTGTEAIVQVKAGPIKTVYLKRLVRQDNPVEN